MASRRSECVSALRLPESLPRVSEWVPAPVPRLPLALHLPLASRFLLCVLCTHAWVTPLPTDGRSAPGVSDISPVTAQMSVLHPVRGSFFSSLCVWSAACLSCCPKVVWGSPRTTLSSPLRTPGCSALPYLGAPWKGPRTPPSQLCLSFCPFH